MDIKINYFSFFSISFSYDYTISVMSKVGGHLHKHADKNAWLEALEITKDEFPSKYAPDVIKHIQDECVNLLPYHDLGKKVIVERISKEGKTLMELRGNILRPSALARNNKAITDSLIQKAVKAGQIQKLENFNEEKRNDYLFLSIHISLSKPDRPRLIADHPIMNAYFRDKEYVCKYEDLKSLVCNFPQNMSVEETNPDTPIACIDLKSFYSQFQLSEESSNSCVFLWDGAFYKYVTLPFGLSCSAHICQETHRLASKAICVWEDSRSNTYRKLPKNSHFSSVHFSKKFYIF